MEASEWLLIIFLLIGLGGTLLPMVPGLGLMLISLVVYSFYDDWSTFPVWYVLIVGFVAGFGMVIDNLASALGAKKFGVSKQGFWGALAGGVLGGLIFQIIGLIIGAIIGTVVMELYQQRTLHQSLTAATGVLVGTAAGMALQFALGLVIVICSILKLVL